MSNHPPEGPSGFPVFGAVNEQSFHDLRRDVNDLQKDMDDQDRGRVPALEKRVEKLEAKEERHTEKWNRVGGAIWVLIAINGVMGFVAVVVSILVALSQTIAKP